MRSILCYLLFAIGGTVTYVCAEEKEQIGSDTLENILFVDDFDAKCIVPDTAIWISQIEKELKVNDLQLFFYILSV